MREFRSRLRRVTRDSDVRALLGGLVGRVVTVFNLSPHHTRQALEYVTHTLGTPTVASLVTADDWRQQGRWQGSLSESRPCGVHEQRAGAEALLAFDPKLAGEQTALVYDARKNDRSHRLGQEPPRGLSVSTPRGQAPPAPCESPDPGRYRVNATAQEARSCAGGGRSGECTTVRKPMSLEK